MLSRTSLKQANVLWCSKNKLKFSANREKKKKQMKFRSLDEDDPFFHFVSMTDIRQCYYKDTHKILGNTFKMCVIQVRIIESCFFYIRYLISSFYQ